MAWLEDYVEYSKNNEAPEHFHWWAGLGILGASLRRNVVFSRGRFKIFPNPWLLVVAPSGTKKTTAWDLGYNILSKLDHVKILSERITPEAIVKCLGKPEENGEVESQAVIYAPEFGTFLDKRHFNEGLVPLLLRLADCPDSWAAETATGGKIQLRNVAVTLLGAMADDLFKEAIPSQALKTGFLARMLVITGKDEGKCEPFPWTDDNAEAEILSSLYELSLLRGDMVFTSKSQDWYIAWYMKHKANLRNMADHRLRAYYERKPVHLLRIGMLTSIAKHKRLEYMIDGLEEASKVLEQLEKGLLDLSEAIDATPLGKTQMRILDHIKKAKKVRHTELAKKNANLMSDPLLFKKIMSHLLETKHIKAYKVKSDIIYEIREE